MTLLWFKKAHKQIKGEWWVRRNGKKFVLIYFVKQFFYLQKRHSYFMPVLSWNKILGSNKAPATFINFYVSDFSQTTQSRKRFLFTSFSLACFCMALMWYEIWNQFGASLMRVTKMCSISLFCVMYDRVCKKMRVKCKFYFWHGHKLFFNNSNLFLWWIFFQVVFSDIFINIFKAYNLK